MAKPKKVAKPKQEAKELQKVRLPGMIYLKQPPWMCDLCKQKTIRHFEFADNGSFLASCSACGVRYFCAAEAEEKLLTSLPKGCQATISPEGKPRIIVPGSDEAKKKAKK